MLDVVTVGGVGLGGGRGGGVQGGGVGLGLDCVWGSVGCWCIVGCGGGGGGGAGGGGGGGGGDGDVFCVVTVGGVVSAAAGAAGSWGVVLALASTMSGRVWVCGTLSGAGVAVAVWPAVAVGAAVGTVA